MTRRATAWRDSRRDDSRSRPNAFSNLTGWPSGGPCDTRHDTTERRSPFTSRLQSGSSINRSHRSKLVQKLRLVGLRRPSRSVVGVSQINSGQQPQSFQPKPTADGRSPSLRRPNHRGWRAARAPATREGRRGGGLESPLGESTGSRVGSIDGIWGDGLGVHPQKEDSGAVGRVPFLAFGGTESVPRDERAGEVSSCPHMLERTWPIEPRLSCRPCGPPAAHGSTPSFDRRALPRRIRRRALPNLASIDRSEPAVRRTLWTPPTPRTYHTPPGTSQTQARAMACIPCRGPAPGTYLAKRRCPFGGACIPHPFSHPNPDP